jgi:hypothetical protein
MIRDSVSLCDNTKAACRRLIRTSAGVVRRTHWKRLLIVSASLIATSCALPSVVQRQTVEYNTAAAAMANQLALMNIIRAEQHLPIFYTSISRLSGSTVVTATGGFNAAIKSASPVDTESLTNAPATTIGSTTTTPPAAPAGAANSVAAVNSVTTTVTNLASRAVTSGGSLYTPSIGGQVVSGPSFDINILDTQQFYQGILADVPFSTIELLINQGFDDQFLMRLLIERIEYWRPDNGELDHVVHNVASGPEAKAFLDLIACVRLTGLSQTKPAPIAPISRVTSAADGAKKLVSLKDLMSLDGQKFDLATKVGDEFKPDAYIQSTTGADDNIYLVRPPDNKRFPHFFPLNACALPRPLRIDPSIGPVAVAPENISSASLFTIDNSAASKNLRSAGTITFTGKPDAQAAPAGTPLSIFVYFRSPEGLIRFLGNYLAKLSKEATSVYAFESGPLFSVVEGHASGSIVSTVVSGESYSIPKHVNAETNMSVLALVEELVNLQKSATDRPVTVPVHVLP